MPFSSSSRAGRIVVRDLPAPEDLLISRATGDTYAAPERPVADANMARLSASLTAFSGTLGHYAQATSAQREQTQNEVASETANRYMATASDTQLAQDYRDGKVPMAAHPTANAAYQGAIGQNVGQKFHTDMVREFGPGGSQSLLNPDGTPVDVDKLVAERAAPYLEGVPTGTPHGATYFNRSVQATRAWLGAQQQQQIAARSAENRAVVINTGFDRVLSDANLSSLAPEQVADNIRKAYAELNVSTKATWAELDDKLVGSLKAQLAEGKVSPQAARNILAVLDAPRKAVDTGADIGALSANPRFANDTAWLRSQATGVLARDAEGQARQAMFSTARDAFLRGDGSFDLVQDIDFVNPITGQRKLIHAQEIKDGAAVSAAQATRAHVTRQFEGQPASVINGQVFAAQVEQFVPAGVVNPEWKGLLKAAITDAASTSALTDPHKQQRLKGAANLYEALRTRSPAYVNSLLDGKERDFYETYHTLRQMGQGDQLALEGAARAIGPDATAAIQAAHDSVTNAVNAFKSTGGGFFRNFTAVNTVNLGQVQDQIVSRAKLLVRTQGITPDAAIKAVQADIETTVPVINGHFQFERSPFLVKGKEPVVQQALDETFGRFPDAFKAQGVSAASDLSVRFENGVYRVIRAATGMPVISPDGQPLRFTDTGLRAFEKRLRSEKNNKGLIESKERAARTLAAPLPDLPGD